MASGGTRAAGSPGRDDSAAPGAPVVINGRFRRQPMTGVQRYATEITRRLPTLLSGVTVAEPGTGWAAGSGASAALAGHVWEQTALPLRVARARGGILLSLCNWGPLAVHRQVLVLHDLAPLRVPSAFSRQYAIRFRTLGTATARRAAQLVTPSRRMADEITDHLGVDPRRITVIAPGVHAPAAPTATPLRGHPTDFALFVGAHDPRKGLDAVRRWWPEAHRRTGLDLVVTVRNGAAVFRPGQLPDLPGCTVVADPDDHLLWQLYAQARLVLSPSRYEGFGMPLLEALSCGTPFLSSDTGAAAELALEPWWVLPDTDEAWVAAVGRLARAADGDLPQACRAAAAPYTWDRAAQDVSRLLQALGANPSH